MSKIVSQLQITPDGFCNHADVVADEKHLDFVFQLLDETDTLLFGRKTYDLFKAYWPAQRQNPAASPKFIDFAERITARKKIVFSTTSSVSNWEHTSFVNKLDADAISRIKSASQKGILLFGSVRLLSQLIALNLIDDYYFFLQPILSGSGVRLFDETNPSSMHRLTFKKSYPQESGVVILQYQHQP